MPVLAMGSCRPHLIPPDMRLVGREVRPEFLMPDNVQAQLTAQGNDTTKLHLILDMNRVGGNLFAVKTEYTYFPPRSGRNHLFEMAVCNWPSGDMPYRWFIMSMPIDHKPLAEATAKECGLRLANGIPHIFDADGAHAFPLSGDTVFTLENTAEHQTYKNDPKLAEELRQKEKQACEEIISRDRKILGQQMIDEKGYSKEQVDRILNHWEHGDESYDEPPANPIAKDGQHKHGAKE